MRLFACAPRHGASPVGSFHVAPVLRSGVQRRATQLEARNDDQVDPKFFAGLSQNPLKSLALLGPVSIFES